MKNPPANTRSPGNTRRGGGKYKNIPTTRTSPEGRELRFASKKEAARYDELLRMQDAGEIRNLKLQPEFTLQEAFITVEGVRVKAIKYRADFSYEYTSEHSLIVEDVKGGNATKTRVYEIKKKMLLERFGIEVKEV